MKDGFTLGALLIGCAAFVAEVFSWWPGIAPFRSKKADYLNLVSPLVPFAAYWCVGALMSMCLGGLVGWAMDWWIWGAGWLGDAAYVWGVGGPHQTAPQGTSAALTSGGLFMACLVLVAAAVRRHKGDATSKTRGWVSGSLMGLSAGVARVVAVPLASGVNIAGAWITGVVS